MSRDTTLLPVWPRFPPAPLCLWFRLVSSRRCRSAFSWLSFAPLAQGDHPNNWRAIDPRTELLGKFGQVSEWPQPSHSSFLVRGMSGHYPKTPVVLGCACWWLSLVWLGAGASGGCWCFSLPCGLFRFPFRRRRPEDWSEGVGIKEGVQAGQSALLLRPELFLR